MLSTSQENGVEPGLKINLDSQSLSLNSELSEPFPLSSPPSGSSSTPLPPERVARQWLQQLGTTDGETVADMAIDRFGNVYLAGSTTGELFLDWGMERDDSDAWLAKFNSSGQFLWGQQILTPYDDFGSSIAVDNAGNVYIAGSTNGILGVGVVENTPGSPDAWLAKYDTNGNRLWAQQKQIESSTSVSDLEVDTVGNVYMTGNSYASRSIGSRNTAWAERYSSNGELIWSNRYSLSFYGETKNILSRGLALDNANNLYVALDVGRWMNQGRPGSDDPHPYWDNGVWRSGIEQDGTGTLVSKYNAFGGLMWQKYLDFSMDRNTARGDLITSDNLGHFYLGSDRGLAKYDSNGSLLWEQEFVTSQTTTNITTDAEGNIYLSGSNANEARAIAYDSQGNLLWETEFGTPADDLASAIAIDADGQVYLAGSTRGALGQANAGETDIWLAQYWQLPDDPNQAPQSLRFSLDRQYKATDTLAVKNGWVQDLDGGIEIARVDLELMDANGMAIASSNITDFSVAAWNPDWAAFESEWDLSTLNLNDGTYRLRAIAYDTAGAESSAFERQFLIYSNSAPERLQFSLTSNQYAANEILTVKNAWVYDKEGGTDIAAIDFELIDTMGNAIDLTDANEFDVASWNHQWANFAYELDLTQLSLNPGIYTLRGTAYDRSGAQGTSFERQFQLNLPTNAALAWVQDAAHRGNDIDFDREGNLYVAGTAFWSPQNLRSTGDDIWIAKYDRDGNLLWQEEWGTDEFDDSAGKIAVDDAGNVYLTATTYGALAGEHLGRGDALLVKYDTNGNRLWAEQLSSTQHDYGVEVQIDEAGHLYVVGRTGGDLGGTTGSGVWIAKYNTNGDRFWLKQIEKEVASSVKEMVLDNAGNIYLTGQKNTDYIWLAKYDANATRLWERQLHATETSSAGVAADRFGNVYIAGYTYSTLTGTSYGESDVWFAKYNDNGDRLWVQQFGTETLDYADAIDVDDAGNVYLTGSTLGNLAGTQEGMFDIWITKHDPTGNLTWQDQWGTDRYERVEEITTDGRNIYLAGEIGSSPHPTAEAWILKYA